MKKLLYLTLILAAVLRLVGLMPNIPYADEAHIQVYSYDIVKNILLHFDFHPHTFKYGSWIFYFQALVAFPIFLLTYLLHILQKGIIPFEIFHEEIMRKQSDLFLATGRFSIAILGVVNVWLLYLIGARLFNKKIGLIAALVLAVAPMHVRESHYMITDVIFLTTILAAFYCFIRMFQDKTLKWFILSGIAAGICATVRYYPIILLAYPIALIFSFEKSLIWLKKFNLSIGSLFIGIFVGVPYLFLDKDALALLARELEKYALPWYETSTSKAMLSFVFNILSAGRVKFNDVALLYPPPEGFRPLHASWIFFNGLGPLPILLALVGFLFLLKKDIKKAFFVGIIPVMYFIYVSFFLPAIYEKLSLPILPFLALFTAFALHKFVKSKYWILILIIVISPQLIKSAQASIACAQPSVQKLSSQWVETNIADNSKISYLTPVTVPSTKAFSVYYGLEPKYALSLEEARKNNADYAFWNGSRIDYETFTYFNDYFVVPADVYENSYEFLAFREYQSRAELLHTIDKPLMCDPARIYYFKLPQKLPAATKAIDISPDWSINSFGTSAKLEKTNKKLVYKQPAIKLTPPRISSNNFPVVSGRTYTFSFDASANKGEPRVIGRIDFYSSNNLSIFQKIKNAANLIWYGSTQMYFEKKERPVGSVALSERVVLNADKQTVTITSKAPQGAEYAEVSIQDTNKKESGFIVENTKVFSSE